MYFVIVVFFFFFKQKTAYEMRISDWSSDVCSSDLYEASLAEWKARGVPDDLGQQLAALPYLEPCCDIIEVARERKLKPVDVARVHFRLGDALRLPWLVRQIDQLPVEGRWHAVADRKSTRLNSSH